MITIDTVDTVGTMNHDKPFIEFYQAHPQLLAMNLLSRITIITKLLLDRSYQLEPLGEGAQGKYSTLPLYRADQFDCVTFVDTVIALSHAGNFEQFKQLMLKIRYSNQQIDYTQRTDWFTESEWNPHLQRLGYLQDITLNFIDERKRITAEKITTTINKPDYYTQKILADLNLPDLSDSEAQQLLTELRAEGKKFTTQPSALFYIPFAKLFDAEEKQNETVWKQFPALSVIEIVRPNWRPVNPKDKQTDYGTHLNISHMGIAINVSNEPIFYHASTGNGIVKLPLVDYLRSLLNDERPAPISGIHVERML